MSDDAPTPAVPVGGMPTRSGSVARVLLLTTLVSTALMGLAYQLGIGDAVISRPGELVLLFIDIAPVLWFAAAAVLLLARWHWRDRIAHLPEPAVIGAGIWESRFAGDTSMVGRALLINNVPFTVIGVLENKGQSMMGTDQDDIILVPIGTARSRVLGAANLAAAQAHTHQAPRRKTLVGQQRRRRVPDRRRGRRAARPRAVRRELGVELRRPLCGSGFDVTAARERAREAGAGEVAAEPEVAIKVGEVVVGRAWLSYVIHRVIRLLSVQV